MSEWTESSRCRHSKVLLNQAYKASPKPLRLWGGTIALLQVPVSAGESMGLSNEQACPYEASTWLPFTPSASISHAWIAAHVHEVHALVLHITSDLPTSTLPLRAIQQH